MSKEAIGTSPTKSKLREYIEKKTDEHAIDSGMDYQVGDLLCVIDACLEHMTDEQVIALINSDSFIESCVDFDKEECAEFCTRPESSETHSEDQINYYKKSAVAPIILAQNDTVEDFNPIFVNEAGGSE